MTYYLCQYSGLLVESAWIVQKRKRPAGPAAESRGAQIEREDRPKLALAHNRFHKPTT
jgi:hypothetical protein